MPTVVISGASGGIGAGIAKLLASKGYNIALGARLVQFYIL